MAKMSVKNQEEITNLAKEQAAILLGIGGGLIDDSPTGEAWGAYGETGRPFDDGRACTLYEKVWAGEVLAHNRECRKVLRKKARAQQVSYAFVACGYLAAPLRTTYQNRHEAQRAWNKHGMMDGRHSTVRLLRYRTDVEAMKGDITDQPGKNGCLEILSTM